MVMKSINMETIKADLEEHKKLVNEIKSKKNDNSLKEFDDTIDFF
jgi:hypothetical protein